MWDLNCGWWVRQLTLIVYHRLYCHPWLEVDHLIYMFIKISVVRIYVHAKSTIWNFYGKFYKRISVCRIHTMIFQYINIYTWKLLSLWRYIDVLVQDAWAVSPSAPPVDGVLYPDDFAAEPPRAPPHHYQPAPPLIPPSRPNR